MMAAAPAPAPDPEPDAAQRSEGDAARDALPAAGSGAYGAEAEAAEEDAAPSEAGNGAAEPRLRVEVEVTSVPGEDGGFTAAIVSDPSGLLSPGVEVTIRPGEAGFGAAGGGDAAPQPGERVTVYFHALTFLPEGWQLEADGIAPAE